MTLDIENEESTQEATPAIEEPTPDLEELLEFKRQHILGDKTRCPVCDLIVPINARRCQHCESNIEANNALVRETLRHIQEMADQFDQEGWSIDRTWRSLKNRIKRIFRQQVTMKEVITEDGSRCTLAGLQPGDQVTIVASHGPWSLVRTPDGREGWIYSIPPAT